MPSATDRFNPLVYADSRVPWPRLASPTDASPRVHLQDVEVSLTHSAELRDAARGARLEADDSLARREAMVLREGSRKTRVTFLFVRALHHAYHTVLPAIELSILRPDFEVRLVVAEGPVLDFVTRVLALRPDHRCHVTTIELGPWGRRLFVRRGEPFPVPLYSYVRARSVLASSDVVVSTSLDTPMILRRLLVRGPRIVYHAHGVGDGSYGFGKALAAFDLVLVGGDQNARRMLGERVVRPEQVAVVGYAKLDACRLERASFELAFPTPRPVVWYAPHWDARLSSLPLVGRRVLEFFARSTEYNFVYAPHLLAKQRASRQGYELHADVVRGCPHVITDLDSDRLSDMSYARAADVYLGDVSSQVYEFVALRPRPCVFLNPHSVPWSNDPSYAHFAMGIVCEDVGRLDEALAEARASAQAFAGFQQERVRDYFSVADKPASVRAARAIEALALRSIR